MAGFQFALLPLLMGLVCLNFAAQCASIGSGHTRNGNFHPVLIMPALTNSQLYGKLDLQTSPHWYCEKSTKGQYIPLWVDSSWLVPPFISCWLYYLSLDFNQTTGLSYNPPGIDIKTPPGLKAVLYEDPKNKTAVWASMVFNLTSRGYVPGVSLRAAPYDWRYGPNQYDGYFQNTTALVEEMYEANGNSSVILISLSMGGPYTGQFLNRQSQKWKDKYIRAWVSLSGALGGSAMAVRALVTEENLPFPLSFYILQFRTLAQTLPSVAWLLPSQYAFNSSQQWVQTPSKNYSTEDMRQLLVDAGANTTALIFDQVKPYFSLDAPGVETYCSFGYNVSTEGMYTFSSDSFDALPNVTFIDGDGVCPSQSLQMCAGWKKQQSQKVQLLPWNGLYHGAEVLPGRKGNGVLDKIVDLILSL